MFLEFRPHIFKFMGGIIFSVYKVIFPYVRSYYAGPLEVWRAAGYFSSSILPVTDLQAQLFNSQLLFKAQDSPHQTSGHNTIWMLEI
jgi:hypothetical protein